MSRKRTFAEMTATGIKEEQSLATCPGRDNLLTSLRAENTILIKCTKTNGEPDYYRLPRDLLRDSSGHFRKQLETVGITELQIDPDLVHVFELYLQWLYTKDYEELDASASLLEYGGDIKRNRDLTPTIDGPSMSWRIKAAILVVVYGHSLTAPKFQNYGIKRLFNAFSRPGSAIKLETATFNFIMKSGLTSRIKSLVQDIVIRNWGDESIVPKDDTFWAVQLGSIRSVGGSKFRKNFVATAGHSLTERRESPLKIEDYLLSED